MCQLEYDTSKSVAETTIRRACESHAIDVFYQLYQHPGRPVPQNLCLKLEGVCKNEQKRIESPGEFELVSVRRSNALAFIA